MRLTPDQHQIILTATREIFGAEAVVRLFGSRVDDAKRGGDIDLWVELAADDPAKVKKSLQPSSAISRQLGDLIAVDVVVKDPSTAISLIHQEGAKGVLL